MNKVNKLVIEFNKKQSEQKELNDFIEDLRAANSLLCKRAATTIRAKDNRVLALEFEIETLKGKNKDLRSEADEWADEFHV